MNKRPTPETDAWLMDEYGDRPNQPLTAVECLNLARRFERQRDELREALDLIEVILCVECDGSGGVGEFKCLSCEGIGKVATFVLTKKARMAIAKIKAG